MRHTPSDEHTNYFYPVKVGATAGAINFCFRLPFETFSARLRDYQEVIFERNMTTSFTNLRNAVSPNHQYPGAFRLTTSLFNSSFGWSLSYRVAEGAITFPLQKKLKNECIQRLDYPHDPRTLVLVNGLTGWVSSMIELLCLHPVESMRIKAQTYQPCATRGSTLLYFFKHQRQLRSGMGVNAIRNTLVTPISWSIKGSAETALDQTEYHQLTRTLLAASAFILSNNLIGNPFEVIRVQLLKETQPATYYERAKQVCQVSQRLVKQQGTRVFWRGMGITATGSFITRLPQICFFEMMTNDKGSSETSKSISPRP